MKSGAGAVFPAPSRYGGSTTLGSGSATLIITEGKKGISDILWWLQSFIVTLSYLLAKKSRCFGSTAVHGKIFMVTNISKNLWIFNECWLVGSKVILFKLFNQCNVFIIMVDLISAEYPIPATTLQSYPMIINLTLTKVKTINQKNLFSLYL